MTCGFGFFACPEASSFSASESFGSGSETTIASLELSGDQANEATPVL